MPHFEIFKRFFQKHKMVKMSKKLNRKKEPPMQVYWTSVEFDIIHPADYENCVGGFVYLFFKATDVQDAMVTIKDALEEEGLKANLIEFVCPYDEIPWDSPEDQILYDSLAKEAEESAEVVWDQISAYESREE